MANAAPSAPHEVIAVFEVGALGDSIVSLPALQALRKARPAARIVRVCSAALTPFFNGCPLCDVLVAYDRHAPKLQAAVALWRRLRRLAVTGFINLHTPDFARPLSLYWRDQIFACAAGARRRAAYYHSLDRWLLSAGVTRRAFGQAAMAVEEAAVVSAYLGRAVSLEPVSFWLTTAERHDGVALLGRGGAPGEAVARAAAVIAARHESPYFCVSPFARNPTREWDRERLARVVDEVAAERDLVAVFLGGDRDRQQMAELGRRLERPYVDLVRSTSIREAAAILERCRFVIAVDSGLMHLGGLVGAPVVALFCAGDPRRWRPLPQAPLRVVASGAGCAPCYLRECDDHRCRRLLTVEAVMTAVRELLYEPTPPASDLLRPL